MALTRKFLKALGLTDEQVESIVDAHSETVDALKAERDAAKEEANKVADIQKQLDAANLKLANAGDAAKVQAEFDAFKQQVETEKANNSKSELIKNALRNAGVNRPEFIDLLARQIDLAGITIENGAIKDNAPIEALKTTYPACFGTTHDNGVNPANPPAGNQPDTNAMSDDEYYRYMAQQKK